MICVGNQIWSAGIASGLLDYLHVLGMGALFALSWVIVNGRTKASSFTVNLTPLIGHSEFQIRLRKDSTYCRKGSEIYDERFIRILPPKG